MATKRKEVKEIQEGGRFEDYEEENEGDWQQRGRKSKKYKKEEGLRIMKKKMKETGNKEEDKVKGIQEADAELVLVIGYSTNFYIHFSINITIFRTRRSEN